jgi:predicted nucleic acid-binding protein
LPHRFNQHRSAIALALETENPLLILDDGQARSFAQDLGLAITGTLGILIAAFRQGIIADLDPVIHQFRLFKDIPRQGKNSSGRAFK